MRDEGEGVRGFMEAAEFTKAAVGDEALRGPWKGDKAEGLPEVFAEVGRDGFLAEERYLLERRVVLRKRWSVYSRELRLLEA